MGSNRVEPPTLTLASSDEAPTVMNTNFMSFPASANNLNVIQQPSLIPTNHSLEMMSVGNGQCRTSAQRGLPFWSISNFAPHHQHAELSPTFNHVGQPASQTRRHSQQEQQQTAVRTSYLAPRSLQTK